MPELSGAPETGSSGSGVDLGAGLGIDLDLGRFARRGYPEAIYCEGKTPDQVAEIARQIRDAATSGDSAQSGDSAPSEDSATSGGSAASGDSTVSRGNAVSRGGATGGTTLFTRAAPEHAAAVLAELPQAVHDAAARLLAWPPAPPEPTGGLVVVACAGTSDLPVAREAALTATYLGRRVELVTDAGVAGLHRILGHLELLRQARAIVCVAGMDGALPSVVAGLVTAPVVAVPTSVGYGAAFGGIAPLLTMLNACAPGVAVVNIDNGYGAGHLAAQIAV